MHIKLTVTDGTALTVAQLPALTAEGYTFGGWYDGQTKAEAGYKVTKNVTLTAKWTVNTYTVTLNNNGSTDTITATYGKNLPDLEAIPTLEGSTFGGYYTEPYAKGTKFIDKDGKGSKAWNLTENTTLYAAWGYPITYKNTKDVQNTNPEIYTGGETVTLVNLEKEGCTFNGWFDAETGGNKVESIAQGSTGAKTFYAQWTLITYTITYEGLNGVENPNTVTSYTVESETITLQNPTRTGYIFNGWFDAETGGNKIESIAQGSTGAKTLYAQWLTFSLQVTGTPSKTLYYVGDSLDTTGLTVTATYSDGSSKAVTGFSVAAFSEVNLGTEQTLTISYTEGSVTKTADVSGTFYVAAAGAKPTESPVALADYSGTLADGTYYKFGDFPQTVSTLTGDNAYSAEPVYNGWYLGSDGYFYAKCTENAYQSSYTYSNGDTVAKSSANSEKYFKVEPIKWRVLNPSASGDKILVAESILTANIPYYGSTYDRTLNETTIYANNYKYSNIRAFLNGTKNQFVTDGGTATEYDVDWTNKGFLQTAFTTTAQALIATTTVDNSAASTNPASNASLWNSGTNDYACDNTSDKIFLLSEKEATTTDYGFTAYDQYGTGNSRIRVTTDYAKANCAYQSTTADHGGWWWVRSPDYGSRNFARYLSDGGGVNSLGDVSCEIGGVVPALSISVGN